MSVSGKRRLFSFRRAFRHALWRRMVYHKYLYLLLFPAVTFFIVFKYVPMYGATLAFREFQYNRSLLELPWVGFKYFTQLFSIHDFWIAFRNTVIISFGRLIIEFPVPLIIALMLNELRNSKLKRTFQTIYTFPHFLSWILVVGIIKTMLLSNGAVNQLIVSLGGKSIDFFTNPALFRPLLYLSDLWKDAGWGTIIYLAALATINPELYQAAHVDGANRFQQLIYISLPGIAATITVLLLLNIGNFLKNGNFDQVLNMYNPAVYEVADIIDTYIYRTTFLQGTNFSLSTAVGLFNSVINFILLFCADRIAKLMGREGIL